MEKTRPNLLAFVTVMSMALGGLGFFSALGGVASVAAGSAIMDASSSLGGADAQFGEEYERVNREMQAELLNVTQSRAGMFYGIFAAHIIIATLLLGGGLLAYRMTAKGRKLLMGAFLVTIAFELGRAVPTVSVQMETAAITEKYVPLLTKAMNTPSNDVTKMMGTIMKSSTLMGVAFAVVFTVVKVGFYTFGAIYLFRNERLFTAA